MKMVFLDPPRVGFTLWLTCQQQPVFVKILGPFCPWPNLNSEHMKTMELLNWQGWKP